MEESHNHWIWLIFNRYFGLFFWQFYEFQNKFIASHSQEELHRTARIYLNSPLHGKNNHHSILFIIHMDNLCSQYALFLLSRQKASRAGHSWGGKDAGVFFSNTFCGSISIKNSAYLNINGHVITEVRTHLV